MIQLFWIAIGGAVGSVLRYFMNLAAFEFYKGEFPLGTLLVNAIGSLIIGVLWNAAPQLNDYTKAFLFVGVLGGFTTFSSFSLETIRLVENDAIGIALMNVLLNNVIGISVCFAGFYLGKLIFHS